MSPPRTAGLLALIALAGCGHTAATRYLTLTPIPPSAPPAGAVNLTLRTPGVRWPAPLDRLEVMRPTGGVRFEADELTRWSAAPGELAAAALTQDLLARLPGLTLVAAGAAAAPGAQELAIDVLALSRTAEGYRLTALVTLSESGRPVRSRVVSVTTPEALQNAPAQAEAISRLLGQLADEIAPALARQAAPALQRPSLAPPGGGG